MQEKCSKKCISFLQLGSQTSVAHRLPRMIKQATLYLPRTIRRGRGVLSIFKKRTEIFDFRGATRTFAMYFTLEIST